MGITERIKTLFGARNNKEEQTYAGSTEQTADAKEKVMLRLYVFSKNPATLDEYKKYAPLLGKHSIDLVGVENDADRAINEVNKITPSVLIMDIDTIGDANDCFAMLKKRKYNTYMIVTTRIDSAEHKQALIDAGVDYVHVKEDADYLHWDTVQALKMLGALQFPRPFTEQIHIVYKEDEEEREKFIVLLAEPSDEAKDAFISHERKHKSFKIKMRTLNAQRTIDTLSRMRPHALILDLDTPGSDEGTLAVLNEMNNIAFAHRPYVIAVMDRDPSSAPQGVDYCINKSNGDYIKQAIDEILARHDEILDRWGCDKT